METGQVAVIAGTSNLSQCVGHMRASDQVRAITTLYYRNQSSCYARTVAYSPGSDMLFSSGDSPKNASSILSGEGFDEVQPGGSPFVVSAVCHLPISLSSPAQRGLKSTDSVLSPGRRCERDPTAAGLLPRLSRPPSHWHNGKEQGLPSQNRTPSFRLCIVAFTWSGLAELLSTQLVHSSSN